MIRRLTFLLAILVTGVGAEDRSEARYWAGRNGKKIKASFVRVHPDTGHYNLYDRHRQRAYQIDPANLSAADRQWVEKKLAEINAPPPPSCPASNPGSSAPAHGHSPP